MPLTQNKLLLVIIGSVCALNIAGCSVPWSAGNRAPTDKAAISSPSESAGDLPDESHGAPVNPGLALPAIPSTNTGTSAGLTEADFAGVIDKLQQIRAIDSTAEPALLEALRRAPASSWPLVTEQFRASLAYREELASKHAASRLLPTSGELYSAPSVGVMQSSVSAPGSIAPSGYPSEPINAPADTCQIELEPVAGEASSRSIPAPPASPAESRPVVQLMNRGTPPAEMARDGPHESPGSVPYGRDVDAAVSQVSMNAPERLAGGGLEPGSTAPGADDWRQLVESAADQLGEKLPKSPTTTSEVHQHVTLRILHLLTGDTEAALEPIPHISPLEQDYWSQQLFALATYLDHHSQPDDKRRAAASVTHLEEAVSSLRELGSLSVRNLSFCKNVYGFGAIEPYDVDRFAPGEHVSLYVEVENYHSRSTEKGYCTSLGSTYEIVNEQGARVGGGEIPDVDDCCRSRRRDFHIQYGLALPGKLAPGQYRLNLVIKDRQSDKMGHATTTFEIRGTPS